MEVKKGFIFGVFTLICIILALLYGGINFNRSFPKYKGNEAFSKFIKYSYNTEHPASSKFDHEMEDNAKPLHFKPIISSSPISKDIVVHCATFDSRQRDGHNNATVFFITTNPTVLENNWITGCGVRDQKAKHYKV